jgi:O-antigen/teichoic acid export membrane protein
VIPQSFFPLFLGRGFAGIRWVMVSYFPVVLFQSVLLIMNSYFTGRGKQRIILYCYLAGTAVAIVVTPVLIKYNGISGAAMGAKLVFGLSSLLALVFFVKNERIPFKELLLFRKDFLYLKGLLRRETLVQTDPAEIKQI